ncbi:MAG: site-specific integrase, partial [Kiloniellales bacterium]
SHAHRLLSKALDDAVRHNLVARNVAAIEDAPSVGSSSMTILTKDQLGTVVSKLRGRSMYPKAITALFTGMRRGELLALRWLNADIDGAKAIRVREALEETKSGLRVKPPKTEAGIRDITLPDIVVEALREHRRQQLERRMKLGLGKLADDALVFPGLDGQAVSPRAFSKDWSRVASSLDMPEITFHALRHTYASQLIDAGVDVVTISRRLGHASPNVTLAIYAHLFRNDDGKAADAINAALAGLARS